jgi:hypothetical protein
MIESYVFPRSGGIAEFTLATGEGTQSLSMVFSGVEKFPQLEILIENDTMTYTLVNENESTVETDSVSYTITDGAVVEVEMCNNVLTVSNDAPLFQITHEFIRDFAYVKFTSEGLSVSAAETTNDDCIKTAESSEVSKKKASTVLLWCFLALFVLTTAGLAVAYAIKTRKNVH